MWNSNYDKLLLKNFKTRGIPWWPSDQESRLPLQGAGARYLVWELRLRKLHGEAKKERKKNRKQNYLQTNLNLVENTNKTKIYRKPEIKCSKMLTMVLSRQWDYRCCISLVFFQFWRWTYIADTVSKRVILKLLALGLLYNLKN